MNPFYDILSFITPYLLGAALGFMVAVDIVSDRAAHKKADFKTKWQLIKWMLQRPEKEKRKDE